MTPRVWSRIVENAAVIAAVLFVVILLLQILFLTSFLLSIILMVFIGALLRAIHTQRQERLGARIVERADGSEVDGMPLLHFLSTRPELQGKKCEIVSVRRLEVSGELPEMTKVVVEYDDARGYVQMAVITASYWLAAFAGWLAWFTYQGADEAAGQALLAAFALSVFVLPALIIGMALKLEALSLLVLALLAGAVHIGVLSHPDANADALATRLLRDHWPVAMTSGWLPAILAAMATERVSAHGLGMRRTYRVALDNPPAD